MNSSLNLLNPSENLLYSLAFDAVQSKAIGFGRKRMKTLIDFFSNPREAWEASESEILQIDGVPVDVLERFVYERKQINPQEILEGLNKKNVKAFSIYDSDYPAALLNLEAPPLVVYYKGRFNPESLERSVAIVGTREPSEYGSKKIFEIAYQLASLGFTIVSGMARGIDTWAHRGSLEQIQESNLESSSKNIAVLANGVDLIVPLSSREIYEKLLMKGCILSEYPPGTVPERGYFPARNRIIAALSKVVLVGEAGAKSGALITAERAIELKLPVFGLAGLPGPYNEGILKWIRKGSAKLITSTSDLIEELNCFNEIKNIQQLDLNLLDSRFDSVDSSRKTPAKAPSKNTKLNVETEKSNTEAVSRLVEEIKSLSEIEKNIFDSIPNNQFISFDKLLEDSATNVAKLNSVLMKLQMKKLIKKDASGALCKT
ncbi:MAG: DNA-processing protein DprA [Candidatus Caenarcaniphilales bacterium]|nr:DNA-processing protein DprA [Candidatus Caenarcaniphilales bacterium]